MRKLSTAAARAAVAAAIALVCLFGLLEAPLASEPGRQSNIILAQAGQPELVDRALAELQSSTDGAPHLYFVGFAGYGSAAVFKREVVAVRELFNERFGTKGRSVALINHNTTVNEFPLASAPNLERVLQHLGKVMDTSRDTLFLFLTSHGDRALFAVEMPGVQLANLTPAMLKTMLDRSGIKNTVVVVSACHSGSFIPALASPTRMVIAAARADRTSFGCDDKRDWTYFGDAYFNKALREETSFKRAFARAKGLVEQWESNDRLTPSLPQMMGGEALTTNE
jgi:Peptidase C13 family